MISKYDLMRRSDPDPRVDPVNVSAVLIGGSWLAVRPGTLVLGNNLWIQDSETGARSKDQWLGSYEFIEHDTGHRIAGPGSAILGYRTGEGSR